MPDSEISGTGVTEVAASTSASASVSKWPATDGRYQLGNPDSPVAVCTMASVALDLPMDKLAIAGKCVTENLGIEKIVQNTVANPKIRFLILCGKVSKGHFVGQAIKSLIENGIDENSRIIGAEGAMPVLKNLDGETIETFRRQVTPVDLIGEEDAEKIRDVVDEYFSKNPGPYVGTPVSEKPEPGIKTINAEPHETSEWVQDSGGFFIVIPDPGSGEIIVEHYSNDRKLQNVIRGKSPEDIYHTIVGLGLLTRHDHAAYLGAELEKASVALQNMLAYEQDKELPRLSEESKESEEIAIEATTEREKRSVRLSIKRPIKEGIVHTKEQLRRYKEILGQIRLDSFYV